MRDATDGSVVNREWSLPTRNLPGRVFPHHVYRVHLGATMVHGWQRAAFAVHRRRKDTVVTVRAVMLSTKVERLHSLILSHCAPRHILRPQSNYLCLTARRSYAARNDRVAASSLLSSALEQKQRENRGEDYVGPFQLGLIPPTPRGGGNTKKWSELSTAGKGTPFAIHVPHSMTFTSMQLHAQPHAPPTSPSSWWAPACQPCSSMP